MTWVVGLPTYFGYAVGISDVRVTLGNGSEIDCLQKIHPVGKFIAVGFAGSVRIGFEMVRRLRDLLSDAPSNQAWNPLVVAEWWPQDARDVFEDFAIAERALGCHLLMVSAHPTEGNGPGPKTYVHIFRSPYFTPELISVNQIGAIGSGNFIEECKSEIDRISSDHQSLFSIMKGEQGIPGGMGAMLGIRLTDTLKRVRPNGVSAHLHYCWVYRGQIIVKTNNHSSKGNWTAFSGGSGLGQDPSLPNRLSLSHPDWSYFTMPDVASSWEQLVEKLESAGASAVGSCA